MSAKEIIESHAVEFGLQRSAQVELLCDFLDSRNDGVLLEALQAFVDERAESEA